LTDRSELSQLRKRFKRQILLFEKFDRFDQFDAVEWRSAGAARINLC
jgi:hypothetical protein